MMCQEIGSWVCMSVWDTSRVPGSVIHIKVKAIRNLDRTLDPVAVVHERDSVTEYPGVCRVLLP